MAKLSKKTKKFVAKGGVDIAKRSKKRRKEKVKAPQQAQAASRAGRTRGDDHVAASVKTLENMNVDDFMLNIIDEISDDEDDEMDQDGASKKSGGGGSDDEDEDWPDLAQLIFEHHTETAAQLAERYCAPVCGATTPGTAPSDTPASARANSPKGARADKAEL